MAYETFSNSPIHYKSISVFIYTKYVSTLFKKHSQSYYYSKLKLQKVSLFVKLASFTSSFSPPVSSICPQYIFIAIPRSTPLRLGLCRIIQRVSVLYYLVRRAVRHISCFVLKVGNLRACANRR